MSEESVRALEDCRHCDGVGCKACLPATPEPLPSPSLVPQVEISTISWRISGSDGYQRNFTTEDDAHEVWARTANMINITSRLEKVTTTAEWIATKEMTGGTNHEA